MARGRERSVSIFTLLHLVFHRCKQAEDGIKEEEEKEDTMGGKNIPKDYFLIPVFCKPELF